MGFNIIVAVDKNRGIGINNQLPWKLKADMQWFKEITISKESAHPNAVIMGRKTWDSIPPKFRPLPNRINIVITRSTERCQANHCVSSFEDALTLANQFGQQVFIIGGSSIYNLAFQHPDFDKLYVTEIDQDFNCDTFFPDYSLLKMKTLLQQGQENDLYYQIKLFQP